jgi:multidrug resistance efflux pump
MFGCSFIRPQNIMERFSKACGLLTKVSDLWLVFIFALVVLGVYLIRPDKTMESVVLMVVGGFLTLVKTHVERSVDANISNSKVEIQPQVSDKPVE